jgi:hypothetical protein
LVRTRHLRFAAILSALAAFLAASASVGMTQEPTANTLTAQERAAGWKLLFDGQTLNGWRIFKAGEPTWWRAIDGTLMRVAGEGELITVDQFADFELRLEWKITRAGNSGIFFRATEESEEIWHIAPEMQVLDNKGHRDGWDPKTSAGSNYALHAPVRDVTKTLGEWNAVRLIVKGNHVEHWLNGVKLLEYELLSKDWLARVAASKFIEHPGYGRAKRGHIGLQDHGDPVWYRNIKIRTF